MPSAIERARSCPLCRKPESAEHSPFCSRSCKDRDLLNWLGEGYRVPGLPLEDEDDPGRVDSSQGDL